MKYTIQITWLKTKNKLSPPDVVREFDGTIDELFDKIAKDMFKKKGLMPSDATHANRLYKIIAEDGTSKFRWFLSKNKGDYKKDDKSDFHVQPKEVFQVERKITDKDIPKTIYGAGPNFSLKNEIRTQQQNIDYEDVSQNTTAMKIAINAGISFRNQQKKDPDSELVTVKHKNFLALYSKLNPMEKKSVSKQIAEQLQEEIAYE